MAKILDGKAAAAEVRSEVADGVAELREQGVPVRLDVILVGEDPASVTYVSSKERDTARRSASTRWSTASRLTYPRKSSLRSSSS